MLEYLIAGMFCYFVIRDFIQERRINDLLDRIMAKNYGEYQYYEEKFGSDVKELDKIRKEARKYRSQLPDEPVVIGQDGTPIRGFDEQWSDDEVDEEKLSELMQDDSLVGQLLDKELKNDITT